MNLGHLWVGSIRVLSTPGFLLLLYIQLGILSLVAEPALVKPQQYITEVKSGLLTGDALCIHLSSTLHLQSGLSFCFVLFLLLCTALAYQELDL